MASQRNPASSDEATYTVRNTFVEVVGEDHSTPEHQVRPTKSVPLSFTFGKDAELLAALFEEEDSDPSTEEGESETQKPEVSLPCVQARNGSEGGCRVRAVTFKLPEENTFDSKIITVKNTFFEVELKDGTPVMRGTQSIPVSFKPNEDSDSANEQTQVQRNVSFAVQSSDSDSDDEYPTPKNICHLKTLSMGSRPDGPHLGLLYAPAGQRWRDEAKNLGNNVAPPASRPAVQAAAYAPPAKVPAPTFHMPTGAHADVQGRVWELSQDPQGCRRVQACLDEGSPQCRRMLCNELVGHVWESMRSPHANYVLQRAIAVMPAEDLQFIVAEMQGEVAAQAAKHKFGCRIVQRLVEKIRPDQSYPLIGAILEDFAAVARHPYGNYVAQNFLDNASREHRCKIIRMVEQDIRGLASDTFGCTVVGAALSKGQKEDQQFVARALLREPGLLVFTACTRHGHIAASRTLQVLEGQELARAKTLLRAEIDSLRASRFGRNVAECLS